MAELSPVSKKCPVISYVVVTINLVSLVCLTSVSAQTQTWQLNPKEPLEKYDMPPAYIYRLETSPRMISQYGLFVSYQVNVDANGNNIVGDAANEPAIAVDPTDGNRMTVGWRQFNTVSSNCRQAGWGLPQMPVFTGLSRACYKRMFSAAIRCYTRMRPEYFSI
jgi:hypothetical protein